MHPVPKHCTIFTHKLRPPWNLRNPSITTRRAVQGLRKREFFARSWKKNTRPSSRFSAMERTVSFSNLSKEGISPVKWFEVSWSMFRLGRLPNSWGIGPLRRFSPKDKVCNFERWPNSRGICPSKRLALKSTNSKATAFPNSCERGSPRCKNFHRNHPQPRSKSTRTNPLPSESGQTACCSPIATHAGAEAYQVPGEWDPQPRCLGARSSPIQAAFPAPCAAPSPQNVYHTSTWHGHISFIPKLPPWDLRLPIFIFKQQLPFCPPLLREASPKPSRKSQGHNLELWTVVEVWEILIEFLAEIFRWYLQAIVFHVTRSQLHHGEGCKETIADSLHDSHIIHGHNQSVLWNGWGLGFPSPVTNGGEWGLGWECVVSCWRIHSDCPF